MSRWTLLCLAALFVTTDAYAADQAAPVRRDVRTIARSAPRVHV